jgi:RNA polymerase sigma-70 factor (ECF subfamily)
MGDDEIIEMLFLRAEESISAIEKKYGAACKKIAMNILGNEEDAEECVNDAYLGVWNTVPPEKPNPFSTFLFRILRNLSLKKLALNKAQKRNAKFEMLITEIEDYLPSAETVESRMEQMELGQAISEFLATLSPENRKIFMKRYWYSESYEQIAAEMRLSKGTVSMRLVRTREKMRIFLKERGIEI